MQHLNRTGAWAAGLLFCCLHAGTAPAQDDREEPWMTDRYEVEVIVFRNLDQGRHTPEQPAVAAIVAAASPNMYGQSTGGPYASRSAGDANGNTEPRRPDPDFLALDIEPQFPDYVALEDGMQLGRVYSRLERLDAYVPILHRAWTQAARPAAEAVPVRVRSDELDEFSFAGTIKLYKERYVHLALDLELAPTLRDAGEPRIESWPAFGDVSPTPQPDQVSTRSEAPGFRLSESRRIRGVNAQYFDHPQFGVIARVSEIELEEESEPE